MKFWKPHLSSGISCDPLFILEYKGIEILEAEACPDHIHMLISIPPKFSISQIMGYLKGKSSLMIFDKFANMKYKYGNRHFWCKWYYVSTIGRKENKGIYTKSITRRPYTRPNKYEIVYRSVS